MVQRAVGEGSYLRLMDEFDLEPRQSDVAVSSGRTTRSPVSRPSGHEKSPKCEATFVFTVAKGNPQSTQTLSWLPAHSGSASASVADTATRPPQPLARPPEDAAGFALSGKSERLLGMSAP